MKPVRTRIAVAVASSALLASGFGAVAVAATSSAAVMSGATAATPATCPNTTVIDYGVCGPTT